MWAVVKVALAFYVPWLFLGGLVFFLARKMRRGARIALCVLAVGLPSAVETYFLARMLREGDKPPPNSRVVRPEELKAP